jgi:hypothetical protein
MSHTSLTSIRAGVVAIDAGGGSGTGWVALRNGLIVTNVHVVGYKERVRVYLASGEGVSAKVVYVDTLRDVAFLMPLQPLSAPPLELGDSENAEPGMRVAAVGHPLGLSFTVTEGILSAVGRVRRGVPYLQTDAALNPGNSGGPLLDSEGNVVGINTWIRKDGQNLGFALPVHLIREPLARFAGSREQILSIAPVYECLECRTPYPAYDDRCLQCGAPVPYVEGGGGIAVYSAGYARAERAVAGLIGRLGHVPSQVWVDKGVWRLPQPSGGEVWAALDGEGDYVIFKSRLVTLPPAGHEGFLRFLLTFNDRTAGPCRIALDGRVVTLSFSEPTAFINPGEVASSLKLLVSMSNELRSRLQQAFDAQLAPPVLGSDNE